MMEEATALSNEIFELQEVCIYDNLPCSEFAFTLVAGLVKIK